jgi:hypothetical protein
VIQSFSEGKPPRKPHEYGNVVICKKDFETYKKFLENKQVQDGKFDAASLFRELGVDNAFNEFHDMFSSHLKDLMKKGKEDVAFSQFIQSFPSCLPNRTYLRSVFDTFKNF